MGMRSPAVESDGRRHVCHHAHSYVMGAECVRVPSDSKINWKSWEWEGLHRLFIAFLRPENYNAAE